jgi:hypothetical protein
MATNEQKLRGSLVAIIVIHFLVVIWHGASHINVPVPLSAAQTAFVTIVIVVLPLIGAALLWTSGKTLAAWLITLSMLASLLFGFVNHFVLDSPDYVLELPANAWRYSFVFSAALLVVTETIGTVLGVVAIYVWRRV